MYCSKCDYYDESVGMCSLDECAYDEDYDIEIERENYEWDKGKDERIEREYEEMGE